MNKLTPRGISKFQKFSEMLLLIRYTSDIWIFNYLLGSQLSTYSVNITFGTCKFSGVQILLSAGCIYVNLLSQIITKKVKVVWSLAYLTCTTGFLQICLYAIVTNPISSNINQNFTTILVRSLSRLGHPFDSCWYC